MNGPTVLIIALFLLNIGLSIKNELDLREIERARRKRASLQPSIPTCSESSSSAASTQSTGYGENQEGEECQKLGERKDRFRIRWNVQADFRVGNWNSAA